MPTVTKAYTLSITVEQFLEACSLIELQEVDTLLDRYINKKRFPGSSDEVPEVSEFPIDRIENQKEKNNLK